MKYNIKILLNESKYDGYEYYDVDDNAVQAVKSLLASIGYIPSESKSWDIRSLPFPDYDNWKINPCMSIPSPKLCVSGRSGEWVTAEKWLKEFAGGHDVWAFRDGNIEKWKRSLRGNYFYWVNNGDTSAEYDKAHQPSHVMLRIEGEEPPEPPVIEKSLYEKIKEICEQHNVSWLEKQVEIGYKYSCLWKQAADRKNSVTNEIVNEYASHLICDFALQIAKEEEKKEKLIDSYYSNIFKKIHNTMKVWQEY